MSRKEDLNTIISHYGIRNQLKKLHEELYELTEVILYEHDKEHLEEEFADVQVLLSQIREYCRLDCNNINYYIDFKIDRQLKRIEGEEWNN